MSKHDTTAKDFFLHLLSSITLYMSAIAFLMVAFQLINYLFPGEGTGYGSGYSSGILRAGISMLIISLPIFLGSRISIGKMYQKQPARKEFALRKWLTYFTLFAAAIIIIIALITIVNQFLSGDLTSRFIFKALATIAVAALVFSYYLIDVRNKLTKNNRMAYQWGTVILSLALIISTFFVVGSPADARMQRFDSQRVSSLNSLMYSIDSYYSQYNALPESLDVLESYNRGGDLMNDPITDEQYGYTVLDERTYELCATFDTNTEEEKGRDTTDWYDQDWNHPVGEYCFERSVLPSTKPTLGEMNATAPVVQ